MINSSTFKQHCLIGVEILRYDAVLLCVKTIPVKEINILTTRLQRATVYIYVSVEIVVCVVLIINNYWMRFLRYPE